MSKPSGNLTDGSFGKSLTYFVSGLIRNPMTICRIPGCIPIVEIREYLHCLIPRLNENDLLNDRWRPEKKFAEPWSDFDFQMGELFPIDLLSAVYVGYPVYPGFYIQSHTTLTSHNLCGIRKFSLILTFPGGICPLVLCTRIHFSFLTWTATSPN